MSHYYFHRFVSYLIHVWNVNYTRTSATLCCVLLTTVTNSIWNAAWIFCVIHRERRNIYSSTYLFQIECIFSKWRCHSMCRTWFYHILLLMSEIISLANAPRNDSLCMRQYHSLPIATNSNWVDKLSRIQSNIMFN